MASPRVKKAAKKAKKQARKYVRAPRLRVAWMVDRPKAPSAHAAGESSHVPFVCGDGSGACAWASRREAIQAAESDQATPWARLGVAGWRLRRVVGLSTELAR